MRKSYSQLGQDLIAYKFFRAYPASDNFFVDIGAFDGVNFSNTRLFFELGWRGLCVEPVLRNYQKLENLYKDTSVITVRAAAADFEGEMVLNVATIPWAQDWGSDVSSPTEDTLQRWPDYVWEKETVPAIIVSKILEQNRIMHVDFVSIDVEGQEAAVLRGFDLQKYQPHLLVVEYSSPGEKQGLMDYMKYQGYFAWVDNGQDIFFVRGTLLKHWKILPYATRLRRGFSNLQHYISSHVKRLVR